MGALTYAHPYHRKGVEQFARILFGKEGAAPGHPALRLRGHLVDMALRRRTSKKQSDRVTVVHTVLCALWAHLTKKPLKKLWADPAAVECFTKGRRTESEIRLVA